jgi:hypothetical protein
MTYEAWTARAVEDRVIEAAETLMLLPHVKGPQAYGSAMPQVIRDWQAYGSEKSGYKRRPSRGAIDRMPEVWEWINALPSQADRVLLYAWAWVKVRSGRKIADFASREGMNVRTLRRAITSICQQIANNLNRMHIVRLNDLVDAVSEITAETDPETVSSVKYASHWRAPDAKPQHLRDQLDPIDRAPALKRAG